MAAVLALPRTSIGKKAIMAVTGLFYIGFVFFHMYGNTKVFFGAQYFNDYAEGLRDFGHPILGHLHFLYVMRVLMIAAIGLHIWAAVTLTRQSQAARATKYAVTHRQAADYAALTMRWGGVALFFFLIYHLAHFTWGIPVIHSSFTPGDAYRNLVYGFQSPINVLLYLVALVALGLHLYHGTWSLFQTLGLLNRDTTGAIRGLAWLLALIIPIGFATVPLSVLFGFVA
ncbi:MAG TPA: succinate dehydrogenase cytochrome b subunit [Caldilineaceae bacterium]|nr:succinate dehydrogenase cytochrome b subunit [Caldilineaceae bacterium]